MKKSILFVAALALGAGSAFGQIESKKGEAFLPESGDWSIGVDATPFLEYVGNMFNGTQNQSAPTWEFLNNNMMITGKMYTSETSAYRAMIRIGMNSSHMVAQVADNSVTSAPTFPNGPAMKEDEAKMSTHVVGLGAGMEMRRGKTRLQGFYGADAMFWMSGGKNTYTYANAFSSTNPNPTSTNWGTNINPAYSIWGGRVTEEKMGSTIGFGVRGFVGAEYFIIPKLSIGAEFGWGLGFQMTGESTATVEAGDPANGNPGNTDYITAGKSSGFMLDVDRNAFGTGNGSLRLNLHF